MKIIILSILICCCLPGLAQDHVKYYNWNWEETEISQARFFAVIKQTDSGWLRNDFFISTKKLQMAGLYKDSSCKTANGWFTRFYANGMMESRGQMINGKYEGLWMFYHSNGMLSDSVVYANDKKTGTSLSFHRNGFCADSMVVENGIATEVSWFDDGTPSAAGRWSADKRIGIWQFFHRNGTVAAREEYDNGKLLKSSFYDETGKELTGAEINDRDAIFKGGNAAWKKFMLKQIYFPEEYKITNTGAITVVVTALIDEDGNVLEPEVSVPFQDRFDRIALEVFKKSPKWIPAGNHNRKMQQRILQPVTFSNAEE